LAVSNLTQVPYELQLKDLWRDRVTDVCGHSFTIAPGKICFLTKE
jgi:hypothetical protein